MRKYKKLEMELHSFCNRSCIWCYVPYVGRNKVENIKYMTDETLYKIFEEVKNNRHMFEDYIEISLVRHQEPMYDVEYLQKRVKQIRELMKDIDIDYHITIYTNGDYLNKKTLPYLDGIDEIRVRDYDNRGDMHPFDMMEKCGLIPDKIKYIDNSSSDENTAHKYVKVHYNNSIWKFYINSYNSIKARTKCGFIDKDMLKENNVQVLNNAVKRTYPCVIMGLMLNIEYDGTAHKCPDGIGDVEHIRETTAIGNINNGIMSFKYKEVCNINDSICSECHLGDECIV